MTELERRLLAIRDHLELDFAIDRHCDHLDRMLEKLDEVIRLLARGEGEAPGT